MILMFTSNAELEKVVTFDFVVLLFGRIIYSIYQCVSLFLFLFIYLCYQINLAEDMNKLFARCCVSYAVFLNIYLFSHCNFRMGITGIGLSLGFAFVVVIVPFLYKRICKIKEDKE